MAGFVHSDRSRRGSGVMGRIKVAVALTEDAVGRIHEVAAACRALGFEHDSTLGGVGVLTGSAVSEDLPKLRRVPGVLAVEAARTSCALITSPYLEAMQARRR